MHELEKHFTHNECSHRFTHQEKERETQTENREEGEKNRLKTWRMRYSAFQAQEENSTFGNSGAT